MLNKPGTAQLKVQKSKVFYTCKRTLLLKYQNFKTKSTHFEKSQCPKIVKGGLWAFWKSSLLQNFKGRRGTLWIHENIFEKKSHTAEKLKGLFNLFRFCKYMKKLLAEATTGIRNRWVPLVSINLCTKKWYIQGERCGLTKKTFATVIVGQFLSKSAH